MKPKCHSNEYDDVSAVLDACREKRNRGSLFLSGKWRICDTTQGMFKDLWYLDLADYLDAPETVTFFSDRKLKVTVAAGNSYVTVTRVHDDSIDVTTTKLPRWSDSGLPPEKIEEEEIVEEIVVSHLMNMDH